MLDSISTGKDVSEHTDFSNHIALDPPARWFRIVGAGSGTIVVELAEGPNGVYRTLTGLTDGEEVPLGIRAIRNAASGTTVAKVRCFI